MVTNCEEQMGRQINFYMTPADEEKFVNFVRAEGSAAFMRYNTPTPELSPLEELPRQGEPFWFALWIWDRDRSPRPVLSYVKEQRYYCVEQFESEVIEFDRCVWDEGRLVRGRLWAEFTGWRHDDPNILVNKSESFKKWFDRLANWIKKHSTKDARGDWMMPGAAEFAKNGGQISQAVLADGRAL